MKIGSSKKYWYLTWKGHQGFTRISATMPKVTTIASTVTTTTSTTPTTIDLEFKDAVKIWNGLRIFGLWASKLGRAQAF